MDLDRRAFLELFDRAARIAEAHFNGKPEQLAAPDAQATARAVFREELPELPTDPDALLDRIESEVLPNSVATVSPYYMNLVTSCGNAFGMAGNLIASAINSPIVRESVAPAATAIELQVVRWISRFIGYPEDADGILVSGGSMANFAGLALALKNRAPGNVARSGLFGLPPMTVYTSTEAHLCVEKAVELLGLGRDQLKWIEVGTDFTIDVAALARAVREDRARGFFPTAVVAQGGAVNTGAVDPLGELADLCASEGLWLHVDGAYGAPAAGTDLAGALFAGLERADSVAVDAHKWFFVPFTAGFILTKKRGALRQRFSAMADYAESTLEDEGTVNFMERGLQMSRDFGALKVWMTFLGYGAARLRRAIEETILAVRHLARQVGESTDFECLTDVPLSVLCFRFLGGPDTTEDEREQLNRRLFEVIEKEGRISVGRVQIKGRTGLRVCNVKFRTGEREVEHLFDVVRANAHALLDPAPRNAG